MDKKKTSALNNKGVAMIMALIIIVALSLMASGLLMITTTEIYVARNDAMAKEAFYSAEAGLKHAERVIRNMSDLSQITAMYQAAQANQAAFSGFNYGTANAVIGYKFLIPGSGAASTWSQVTGRMGETTNDHLYEVFIMNNDPTNEVVGTAWTEQDGVFFIRSVGYANALTYNSTTKTWTGSAIPATRKILEQCYFLRVPMMNVSIDSLKGGPGNIGPIAVQ